MNFSILSEDSRKLLYKLLSEKEYKAFAKKQKLDKAFLFKFSVGIDKVSYTKIREYVEDNTLNAEDKIVDSFKNALAAKICEKFKEAKEISSILDDSPYEELTEEQKDKLNEYEKAYEDSGMPIPYEEFIKFNCVPSKDEAIQIIVENAIKDITKQKERVEDELEKTKKQLFDLKTSFNTLNSEKKKLDNEVKTQEKQIKNYEKKLNPENVITNIKKILKAKPEDSSVENILLELDKLEKEYQLENKYDKEMEVLAAKYAIVKSLKEGK